MENNIYDKPMNASIIEKRVGGRIEPKIYAFKTDMIPNYLKVGYTERTVEERLDEWRGSGFTDLSLVGEWPSEIEDREIYFADYSVHDYLIQNGYKRLEKNDFPGRPYSKEFFKNASRDDVQKAINDIIKSVDNPGAGYTYYCIKNKSYFVTQYIRDDFDWMPRDPLQTDAIRRFKEAYESNRDNLLMYAVMRFGKSFTSLCCAQAINAKFVLVVSGKADVADEWQRNVQKPGQFGNFVFLNSKDLKKNDSAITNAQAEGNCIVLFLTLQDLSKVKRRFAELFRSQIDLMIIDETHFGARADSLGKVISDANYKKDTYLSKIESEDGIKSESLSSLQCEKAEKELDIETRGLNVRVKLHLSGTPYRILMGSEFEKEDIISFCQYSDIIREKQKWYRENIAGGRKEITGKKAWENPYFGFPEMIRFAFHLNESSMNRIKELQEKGYTYHLSALFAPKSIERDDSGNYQHFEYESEVVDFLFTIDGKKNDKNVFAFLNNQRIKERKLCRHMVMVLPYCASCDAMESLIKKNNKRFINLKDFKVLNISGINSQYKTIGEVKSQIEKCDLAHERTLTLTVNRMLTGCTVPEWDTMIFLKDTASPQEYDQAIFRLQSQHIREYVKLSDKDNPEAKCMDKKDLKPQTILIDFNPQRMFYLQETKSRILNINTVDGGNDESEQRIKADLEVSPIIHVSDNKLVEVTPTDILKAVSEYSVNRGITEAANDIVVDETLIKVSAIRSVIDKEYEITSYKGISDLMYSGEESDLDDEDYHASGETECNNQMHQNPTRDTVENESDIEVFVKKCRSYYRRILMYAFLCTSEQAIKNLAGVIASIESHDNQRIIYNLGLDKEFLVLMSEKMKGEAKRSLDNKIYDLYRLSHEYKDEEHSSPVERATTAIERFGKISDSEVLTPLHVAKEMVNMIPEEAFISVFNNGNRFLDIASKMGEYSIAICERAVSLGVSQDKIRSSICSIPTSKFAYEFTRFIYIALGLDINCIAENYTTYDLLKVKKFKKSGKNKGAPSNKIDYAKIADLIKQNKPFNEITLTDCVESREENVSFDVILGNPPYQVNDGGGDGSSAKPIFHFYVEQAKELDPKYLIMIVPAKWYSGGKGLDSFRNSMLHDDRLAVIHDFPETSDCFPGLNIRGGVCYFLYDRSHHGNCIVFNHKGNDISMRTRPLLEKDIDIFIRYNNAISILDRVKKVTKIEAKRNKLKVSDLMMDKRVCSRQPFGIVSDFNDYVMIKDADHPVILYRSERKKSAEKKVYINSRYITKNIEWKDRIKILVSKASPGGDEYPHAIISSPIIAGENSVCTETYLIVDFVDNKEQAENLVSYMKTSFFRFMMALAKSSHNLTKSVFCLVPVQDYNKPWTDEELYRKYKINKKEQRFIESLIKPFSDES